MRAKLNEASADRIGFGRLVEIILTLTTNMSIARLAILCLLPLAARPKAPLRPSDLPPVKLFSGWGRSNSTVELTSLTDGDVVVQEVATAGMEQSGHTKAKSSFQLLPGIVRRSEIDAMLKLLRGGRAAAVAGSAPTSSDEPLIGLDGEPDSVDGMPTREVYIDSPDLREKGWSKKTETRDHLEARRPLRRGLKKITEHILADRITPFVRKWYPDQCDQGAGRECTPCWSLVRRYKDGDRRSHGVHRDGHALVTVVVSLSDYGRDYTGGLFVSTDHGRRRFLALKGGDAVVHQGDLLHGVQVYNKYGAGSDSVNSTVVTERWSWIIWFKDSGTCADHGHEWYEKCAKEGNPTCEFLHSTKIGYKKDNPCNNNLNMCPTAAERTEIKQWMQISAKHGLGDALIRLTQGYLGGGGWDLPYDPGKAMQLYHKAVNISNEPGAHYGIATLLLTLGVRGTAQLAMQDGAPFGGRSGAGGSIAKVVHHLEAAALGGHEYAMFNLGIVHLYGYGGEQRDKDLAADWFEVSGIPEGYQAKAMHSRALGDKEDAAWYERRAKAIGFGHPLRLMGRKGGGAAGVGGVDLNMQWPPTVDGNQPPKW